MKLTEYMALRNKKQKDLARGIDMDPVTIHRIITRQTIPRKTTMDKIVEWSGGEVTLLDLFDEFFVHGGKPPIVQGTGTEG